MSERFFIDANVPMYAHGTAHKYRLPCQQVLRHIVNKMIPAVTSSEVHQEIVHRYLSLARPEQAVQVSQDFARVVPHILPVTIDDVRRMLSLISLYPAFRSRDLIHIAVMLNNDIKYIISTDTHFDLAEEVQRIDPVDFVSMELS
ncbi:MAG: type II toxin-antitoxin system VapC family toxin [Anaerolineae bacterium]